MRIRERIVYGTSFVSDKRRVWLRITIVHTSDNLADQFTKELSLNMINRVPKKTDIYHRGNLVYVIGDIIK